MIEWFADPFHEPLTVPKNKKQETAGEVVPPSNPLTGPAPPERPICAPGVVLSS